MSLLRRIAMVVRSYTRAAQSRANRIAAEEELRAGRAARKALEELGDLGSAPGVSVPSAPYSPSESARVSALAANYRLLGLGPGAGIEAVEAAWRRLAARADPKRFPAGTEDEKRAAEILKSINKAYARIRENLNPTEGRFGQLEL